MTDAATLDRARGALLGLAVGDAVGTTLEFQRLDTRAPLSDMVGGGPFDLAPGEWTDDTSMALALADSLIECGGLDPTDLATRFVAWWRRGDYSHIGECFDIGITTRAALHRFERDGEPLAGSSDEFAAGNGSLMRLAPVAIWGWGVGVEATRDAARLQSAITHAAPACLDSCEAYAVVLRSALTGCNFEAALEAADVIPMICEVAEVVGGSWRDRAREHVASSGFVLHTLEATLWCVAGGGGFREVVLRAANLGEDADTTAAVAGQLVGALEGVSAIPDEWLAKLAWRDRIEAAADRLLAVGRALS